MHGLLYNSTALVYRTPIHGLLVSLKTRPNVVAQQQVVYTIVRVERSESCHCYCAICNALVDCCLHQRRALCSYGNCWLLPHSRSLRRPLHQPPRYVKARFSSDATVLRCRTYVSVDFVRSHTVRRTAACCDGYMRATCNLTKLVRPRND